MKVGFTGTRHGATPAQLDMLCRLLKELGATELHHGDCVGADAEAHQIAKTLGLDVIIHPGPEDNAALRAFCQGATLTHEPKKHLERNRCIVECTDTLIGCPEEDAEQQYGGTWYTIRYARNLLRPYNRHKVPRVHVILRDGRIQL